MPKPPVLDSTAYALVWSGPLNVAGKTAATKSKTFHSYVEVREQGAHDAALRGEVVSRQMDNRPFHKGRVKPNNTDPSPLNYYATKAAAKGKEAEPGHGQFAATLAAAEMHKKWAADTSNSSVFIPGKAHVLTGQAIRHNNGHCYETTMWYDVHDVYVAFHCYDPVYNGK